MNKKNNDKEKDNEKNKKRKDKELKKELSKVKTKKQKLNKKNKVKKEKDITQKGCFETLFSQIKMMFSIKTRSTRREYYLSVLSKLLINIILLAAFAVVCHIYKMNIDSLKEIVITYLTLNTIEFNTELIILTSIAAVILIFNLIVFFTFISLTARRFHDAGISSKTYFMSILSMIVFTGLVPYITIHYPDVAIKNVLIICLGLPCILKIYIFMMTLLSSDDDNKWGLNKYNIVKERNFRRKKLEMILDEDRIEKEKVKEQKEEKTNTKDVNFSVRKVKTFNNENNKEQSLNKMDLLMRLNNGEITPEEYDELNEKLKNSRNIKQD